MNGQQIAKGTCATDQYQTKDGTCCNRCDAGSYMQAECDVTNKTKCAECKPGHFTATKNNLSQCRVCKICSSSNNQRTAKDCTGQKDTVCECVDGFYCSNDGCDHCLQVNHCSLGKGVIVQANRTSNAICAPCKEGTYSNVTDSVSTCQRHTRCEDFGKVLKTPGNQTTDVVCSDFKHHCHWILPAGLWSGLVLTALVLFGLICWREKRKSNRAAGFNVPVASVPEAPVSLLKLPLPSTELNGYCQESCNLPLFNPDENVVICRTQESVDSCIPITPLKASVSFAESNTTTGRFCTSDYRRTYSEPQEDEWCGT